MNNKAKMDVPLQALVGRAKAHTGMEPLPKLWSTNESEPPRFDRIAYDKAIKDVTLTAIESGAPTPSSTAVEQVLESLPSLEQTKSTVVHVNGSSISTDLSEDDSGDVSSDDDDEDDLEAGDYKHVSRSNSSDKRIKRFNKSCQKNLAIAGRLFILIFEKIIIPRFLKMIITFAVIIILLGAKISSALLVFCLIGMVVGEILLVILQCLQKTFENLNRIVATLSFILNSFSEIALRALCICAGIKIYGKYLISTDNGKQYTPIVSSEEEQYLNGWIINVLVLAITYGVQRTFIRWMLWIWTAEKFRSRVEQTKPKRRVLRALADVAADYEAHIDLQIKFEHELAAGTAIARALGKLTKEKNQQEEGKYDNNDEGNKIITSSPSRVGQCTSFLRRYAIERGIAPPPPIGTPLDLRSSSANNLRQRKCSPGKEQISNNSANRPAFLLQQTSCTLLGRNSIVQERSALEQDDDEQQRRGDFMKAIISSNALFISDSYSTSYGISW
mmetsp:Transcript_6844/g.8699  ORF Transcript_6844/g.8699 Transcript_6844/m.8699 type:complete len:502 (+) Transcript_6844:31-1536(+)